jgi:hypothetical protein
MIRCPHCHQPMPIGLPEGLYLTPRERIIIDKIRHAGDYGSSAEELIDAIYRDRADGGPENASRCLWTAIDRLKKKLAPYGFQIKGRGPSGCYTLERPYDAAKDVEGCFNDAYAAVRERVAKGGKGWIPGGSNNAT